MNNLFKKVVSSVALVAMLAALIPTASFAATISEGDLVKAAGSSAIYLIQDGKKRVFPHSSVYLSWGYPANYSTVKTVTAEELAAYAEGDAVIYRDGFMFRFKGVGMTGGFDPSAVFFVSDGKVRPIESATAYMKLFNGGVNESAAWDRVYWIPDDLLAKFTYPQGSNITSAQIDAGQLPNGLVVRDSNSLYYVVNGGLLSNVSSTGLSANRYTANSNVFSKMLVTKLANSVLNLMPAGAAITTADTSLLTVKKLTVTPSATNVILSSDKTSVEADGASYATLTATVPSTVTSVSFVITSGSGMLSAGSVTPVNGVATVRVTPNASSVSGTLTVSASATGLTSASVTLTTVANTLAPQVVSVSAQGVQLLNVVFDKAVDKTTAETTTNYTPKNDKGTSVTVSAAKLLDDGKTVQLKLAAGFYNNSTEDSVEVKNVQNSAQSATMSTVTKLMTVTDTAVPTVVAVEALGSRAVRVTFSEAVSGVAIASFKMDDKTLAADAANDDATILKRVSVTYPDAGDYTKALINFGNGLTVGAHTLTVGSNNTITDYNVTTTGTANAYTMQSAGYVATVVADTSVPTLSDVEVLSQTKVRYTFSKSVSTPVAAAFFYSTSSTATSGTFASSVTKVSDKVYEASWSSAITTGNVYFYAGTSSNNVTDYSGNTISPLPSSRMVSVASDTAPAISSVSMDTDSDRVVVVMFSKDVDESSAETSSNYVFKSSTGTVLTSTTGGTGIGASGNPVTAPVKDGTNAKKVTLTLGSASEDAKALPGGTYQLCITNVKALSASSSSAMPVSCYSFSVTDKTRPTLYSATTSFDGFSSTAISAAEAGSSYAGRMVIKYSEAMGSSALTAANYKVKNVTGYTTWTKLSDISGVTLAFRNSNKDVVIDFPNSVNLQADTELMIGYIDGSTSYTPTDVAGNLFKNPTNDSVSVSDDFDDSDSEGRVITLETSGLSLATGLSALKVKSATTFEATFSRNVEAISASEFLIDNNASSSAFQPTNATICTLANYENRASTGCEEENESKVIFTIPSGTSYEFTAADGSSTITLSTQSSALSTTKDTLGLVFANNTSKTSIATNDIKPVLKSFVLSGANTLVLTFDGKIKWTHDTYTSATNERYLADDIVISQTVGTTTTTITGASSFSDVQVGTAGTSAHSTVVTLTTNSSLSLLEAVTIKTVAQDSIDAIGSNNAKIAANTSGITDSSFVASSVSKTLAATPVVANNDIVAVSFNKNVDKTSIVSTGWAADTTTNISTYNCTVGNDTCYAITSGVTATFDKSTNKISFSGANVGDLEVGDIAFSGTSSTSTISAVVYNETDRIMLVKFGTPTDATTSVYGDMVYVPSSSIKTTEGTSITTTFKPVAAQTTAVDTTAPQISSMTANVGATSISVEFNEDMDESLVETVGNWSGTTDGTTANTISSVVYTAGTKTAVVTVGTAIADGATLTAGSNIKDMVGNVISSTEDTGTVTEAGATDTWAIN